MAWPLNQDYNEAIQDPRSCLSDPELRDGEAVCNALGLPRPRSGNFADVYEMNCPASGGRYAVKCFTREVRGLQARYQAISDHLHQAKLPFTVDFKYLDKGIQIRGQWYPILKMQWVEGFTLNEFVRQHLDKPAMLDGLLQIWTRMARRLREANLAHADLQHGNVLLVPGSTASSLAVKLIDYDGMHVPALAGKKSGEVGHPAFQHPQRLREGTYNAEVDRFPLLVISAALRCLMVGGRDLWERYDTGDNLLFRETDLRAPEQSELFAALRQLKDPLAVELVNKVAAAVLLPLEQAPLLEELFPERKTAPPRPAARDKQGMVEKKPEARSAPAATIQAEPSAAPGAADAWGGLEPTEPISRRIRKEPAGTISPLVPVVAGGGVACLVLVALLAWAFWPATPKKPVDHSLAQAGNTENNKPPTIPLPRDKDRPIQQPDPVIPPIPVNPPVRPPINPPVVPVNPLPNPLIQPPPAEVKTSGKPWPHTSPVLAVAISRDGQTVAAGCADGTIHVRHGADPNARVLRGHTEEIKGLVFFPDGQTLASASRDRTLKLWEVRTGVEKHSVVAHQGGITSLALSPDGKLLATSSKDGTAKLWDVVPVREKAVLAGHEGAVNAVAFSPDGKTVATVGDDYSFRLWDAEASVQRYRLPPKRTDPCTAVSFAPDGKTLVVGTREGRVILYDLANLGGSHGGVQRPGLSVNALAHRPDGRYLVIGYSRGIAAFVKAEDANAGVNLSAHTGDIMAVAFDASGQTLILGGRDNQASIWTLTSTNPAAVNPDPLPVKPPENPPGTLVFRDRATLPGDPIPSVWMHQARFSRDGSVLVTLSRGMNTLVWDLTNHKMRHLWKTPTQGRGEALSPNGQWLVWWGFKTEARLFDLSTRQERSLLAGSNEQTRFRIGLDNKLLVSMDDFGNLRIWDPETGREKQALASPRPAKNFVISASEISTNHMLVVCRGDGWLQPWDLAAGQPGKAFPVSAGAVAGLTLSPDGKLCATCDRDSREVRIWNVATGQALPPLRGAPLPPVRMILQADGLGMQLAFRADGKVLYGICCYGLMVCWDVASGQELARGTVAQERNVGVMWLSPDSTTLAYVASFQAPIYLAEVQGPGVPVKP